MNGKLIAAFPGKRFDINTHYSDDGRGGWCLAQMNVDRSISTYEDYYLIFCFAALIENADPDTRVENTKVVATMHGKEIGCSEMKWRSGNEMWTVVDGDAIFEWPQCIEMEPESDGLIQFSVHAKLTTLSEPIALDGNGYARIQNVGEALRAKTKFCSSWKYGALQMLPRKLRRKL